MLNTVLFFLVVVLPKILLSMFIGVIMLLLTVDIFLYTFPERSIELIYAIIDLIIVVSTFGSCKSLEELNAKAKKEGMDEIDPFDFF